MKLCTEMNQLATTNSKISNYLWLRRCGFITKIKTFNFGLCFPILVHANFLLFYRECIIRFFTVASIFIHQEEFIDPQFMAVNFCCNHYNLDKECLTFIINSKTLWYFVSIHASVSYKKKFWQYYEMNADLKS